MPTLYTVRPSPIGPLLLTSDGQALTGLFMEEHRHGPTVGDDWDRSEAPFATAFAWLDVYFAGECPALTVPIRVAGTPFQHAVWKALLDVPYGETESYGGLAKRLGDPGAVRAVGAANGRNPVSILVPCHRVVGADGSLTGYGGGMERKRWLLEHESRQRGLFG